VVLVTKARKQLRKLDKSTQRNIRDKLKLLAADSPNCDVKKIQTKQNLYHPPNQHDILKSCRGVIGQPALRQARSQEGFLILGVDNLDEISVGALPVFN